jgi:glycosyltransferase involved in cell wall biosynthesis
VLHGITEIAGQVALSAFGLREIGVPSHAYFDPHRFGYALDPDFSPRGGNGLLRRLDRAWSFPRLAMGYDVVHYHFGRSAFPEPLGYPDARFLRARGKTVVVEFWGSDVRLPSVEARRNPHYVNAYAENDRDARRRMARWAAITGGHLVAADHVFDEYVAECFPHVHVVGQRLDTARYAPAPPSPAEREPLVVHAPSHRAGKGTRWVREAVETLRARGLRFRYEEVFGKTQAEATEVYRRADLIVDQLCSGSYGIFAVEGMSLAKPVICYLLPEVAPTYPADLPILNADPITITAVLEEWLQRPEDRHALGLRSRAYAERVHDCRVVAGRLVEAYGRIGRGERPAPDPR